MDQIPDAKILVENQITDTLAKIRQAISSGLIIEFEETYEPPHETVVSYWGKALLELIGAYAKDGKIGLIVWVKDLKVHGKVVEEFWGKLSQKVYEELIGRIPDLKWASLEAYLFDSLDDLEKAALYGVEL
jgi:hypothetical protein